MDKEQTTIRIPPELAKYIRNKAEAMGTSTNAFIMVLIDMGLRLYESDIIRQVEPPNQ